MTTKTYTPTPAMTKGDDIQFSRVETCNVCGKRGTDIKEFPTYDAVLGRDTTEMQCIDITACLNRKYAGTYMERVNA